MNELKRIIIPKETANDDTVQISELCFKNGDKVAECDIIADIESSKVVYSIETEIDGFIHYLVNTGEEVAVGTTIAIIYDSYDISNLPKSLTSKKDEPIKQLSNNTVPTEYSFSAESLISQHSISKDVFANKSFVTKKDVLDYINNTDSNITTIAQDTTLVESSDVRIENISSTKKREISNLQSIQGTGLTCTFSINIDYDGVSLYARKNHNIFLLSITPTLLQEIVKLLEEFPILNSYFHNDKIVKYKNINIGYAIDLKNDLRVVTIYDANKLSLNELETQLQEKIDKYNVNKLEQADISNSTFTISDLSNTGIHYFSPLVNKNQAIIIGVSSLDLRTNSFTISLTFDHRITEGKTIAMFLSKLKKNIEIIVQPYSKKQERNKIKAKLNDAIQNMQNEYNGTTELKEVLKDVMKLL
jgi:pyruvate dehydrogenase E2 component (dihydrolipoamide acetyltransferase)